MLKNKKGFLGFSKSFTIAIFIGIIFWTGLGDYKVFFKIVGVYIFIRIIWKFLTHGKEKNI